MRSRASSIPDRRWLLGGVLIAGVAWAQSGLPERLPAWSAIAFDVDGDGAPEFTSVTHGFKPGWWVLRDGAFVAEDGAFDGVGGDRHGMVPCDVDRDGRFELIVGYGGGGGTGGRAAGLYVQTEGGWVDRGPAELPMSVNARMRGVNCVDVDGDGAPELYITAYTGDVADLLLKRGPDGWVDVAAQWGLDDAGTNVGSTFGDVDGDGDVDLIRFNALRVDVLRQSEGRFVRESMKIRDVRDVELSDLDGDGDLDLYLARVGPSQDAASQPGVRFVLDEDDVVDTARWAIGDCERILLSSHGAMGGSAGVRSATQHKRHLRLVPQRVDYPEPVEPGLVTWIEGGVLVIEARDAVGIADVGVECGQGSGLRFLGAEIDDVVPEPEDVLLLNRGDGSFRERLVPVGAGPTTDVVAVDFDLDGDTDLFRVTAGLPATMDNAPHGLLINDGAGSFELVAMGGGRPFLGHLALPVDLDADLAPELLVFNGSSEGVVAGELELLPEGAVGDAVRVLVFDADGARSLGAWITVKGETRSHRPSDPTRDYRGASDQNAVFGIGSARAATVEVRWPDGARSTEQVQAGGTVRVVHP